MAKPRKATEATAERPPPPALDQRETAIYIADVAIGLRKLASSAELSFLTYLLDMAVHEALERGERRRKFRDEG